MFAVVVACSLAVGADPVAVPEDVRAEALAAWTKASKDREKAHKAAIARLKEQGSKSGYTAELNAQIKKREALLASFKADPFGPGCGLPTLHYGAYGFTKAKFGPLPLEETKLGAKTADFQMLIIKYPTLMVSGQGGNEMSPPRGHYYRVVGVEYDKPKGTIIIMPGLYYVIRVNNTGEPVITPLKFTDDEIKKALAAQAE